MWPVDVEAVQFTGENWAEMHQFTGHAMITDGPDHPVDVFISIDAYTPTTLGEVKADSWFDTVNVVAMVWIEVLSKWHPVSSGDWIIKTRDTFQLLSDAIFRETYTEVVEPSTDEPTERGFYYNDGSAQVMIYLLGYGQQWYAVTDSPTMDKCDWGYIEQTIQAYPLKKLGD